MRHKRHEPDDFGEMSDPDWGRVLVPARHQTSADPSHTPLGDPTRWGAQVDQTVPAGFAASGGSLVSSQINQVQCLDAYPRSWSIAGTIKALDTFWTPAPGIWVSFLEVRMGIGQNIITHRFDLLAVVAADAPFYVAEQFSTPPAYSIKPFIIPGAVVANSIQTRWFNNYILGADVLTPFVMNIAVQVTPFAAGTGL